MRVEWRAAGRAIAKRTAEESAADGVTQLAAALAYYAVFSLAPLLLIAVALAGLFLGEQAARGGLEVLLSGVLGAQTARAVEDLVARAYRPREGVIASVLGIALLFLGAAGVLKQLRQSLNTVWDVVPQRAGGGVKAAARRAVRENAVAFGMVLLVGGLLLVSLVLTTLLSAMGGVVEDRLPGGVALWRVLGFVFDVGLFGIVFALVFRVVPDAVVAWRDLFVGALATAVLFTVGKAALGLYIGRAAATSEYGAAGAVVALLLWVYYSALILFLGAEFTQAYAEVLGDGVKAAPGARMEARPGRAREGRERRGGAA